MKAYAFNINPRIINYTSSIRSKITLIQILIKISRYLINAPPKTLTEVNAEVKSDEIRLVIYIDKMSRVFLSEKDKIHSFYFPFALAVKDIRCILSYNNFEIDSATCAVLEAVFEDLEDDTALENVTEKYWEIEKELGISSADMTLYGQLITYLLSFEPGYLRFDHDEIHKNVVMHPEHHFDINYTNGATFKFGLPKQLKDVDFIDIIDSNTSCLYLTNIKP